MNKSPEYLQTEQSLYIVISPDDPVETSALYCFLLQISDSMEGRAVACRDFLPGISLILESGRSGQRDEDDLAFQWELAGKIIAEAIEDTTWLWSRESIWPGYLELTREQYETTDHTAQVIREWRW